MDRRSIIFIVGMTVLFFLMNQWFEFGKTGGNKVIEPMTQVEFLNEKLARELTAAERNQLGIIPMYRDVELRDFFCYAYFQNGNLLTISQEGMEFPQELFIQNPGSSSLMTERVDLRISAEKHGEPVLYSLYPLSKLVLPWIPDEGEYKVQMVFFEGDKVMTIDGTTYGIERAIFDSTPENNAIVFLDFKKSRTPYGYFNKKINGIHYLNSTPSFENYAVLNFPTKEIINERERKEQYYVLENDYFQLVFSNYNGALAEINLPFRSETNSSSVVRPIEFDRILKETYPDNDKFPQYSALKATTDGKTTKVDPSVGGYYPLIRRDLIGSAGDTTVNVNPHYYATTVFEKDTFPFVEEFTVTRFEPDLIEFEFKDSKRKITKTFSIPDDADDAPYCLNMSINIDGDARHLVVGAGIPEVELISGSFNPTLKYRQRSLQKPKIEQIKTPKTFVDYPLIQADWYCNGNGFFGIILDPLNREASGLAVHPISGELVPSRLTLVDAQYQRFPSEKFPGYGMHTPLLARPGRTDYRLYLGPFDKSILKRVDRTFTDPITGYGPDYSGAQSYHGWFAFISQPFAKFLFVIMDFFHSITGSWGISIILLTVVLRLMLYPLNNWSMRSNAKLQKLSPKIKEIQEKYKKDQKRVQMEMMNIYKREKVNPFGGCFPILIQLPFLFGMFDLLKSSFELRGATFIPGWIDSLTAPDVLFSWSYPIPFFGTSFHLLPVLLGVIMFIQQKVMSAGKVATDQQKQQKMMGNVMTIVFTVMFYNFPSGLNLYWMSSMLLGILQQWYVNKKINSAKG